jgi:SAM-dependent methyltransferase
MAKPKVDTKAPDHPSIIPGVICPACKKERARIHRVGIREDPKALVYACRACLLQFIEPVFTTDQALREYYRTDYRKEHPRLGEIGGGDADERFMLHKVSMGEAAKKFMEAVPEGASVLEIGPGAGGFLGQLEGKYDLYANEWNPDDAAYIRKTGEVPCEEGSLADIFPGKTFTAIAAIHVLEHQPDPVAWLDLCKSRLIGGGWLYLELPNVHDARNAVYMIEQFRRGYYQKAHITYWQAETLGNLLSILGFEARISFQERYSLYNHLGWLLYAQGYEANGHQNTPMRTPLDPVPEGHPLSRAVNRVLRRLDSEYRVQMITNGITDALQVMAQRREI